MESSTKRFPGIDMLRIVFCLGIIIYHVNGMFGGVFSHVFPLVCHYGGYWGNYSFFISSGFLMSYHYKAAIQQMTLRSFVQKRIRKIYPMYVLSNIAVLILTGFQTSYKEILSMFFMMSNGWLSGESMPPNYPGWFICILMICYLLYYAVIKISANHPRLFVPICLFIMVWGMILEKMSWDIPLNYRTCGEGYMNFFLGALASEFFARTQSKRDLISASGCLVLSAIFLGSMALGFETLFKDFRWGVSAICVCLICIALHSQIGSVLSFLPLDLIGKSSMTMLLWHIPFALGFCLIEESCGLTRLGQGVNSLFYFCILIIFTVLLTKISVSRSIKNKT